MAFESSFKAIDNTLRHDDGCSTALDYVEQSSWVLFLKYFDDLWHNVNKIWNPEMEWLGFILIATLIVLVFLAICGSWENRPTWTGIIISAVLGCLGFYLVLCFFGIMGEEENEVEVWFKTADG